VTQDPGELSAEGKFVHSGRPVALVEAKLADAKDRLSATRGGGAVTAT